MIGSDAVTVRESRNRIEVAERIISSTAVQYRHPDPADVEQVRGWAVDSREQERPIEELARVIIRRELRRLGGPGRENTEGQVSPRENCEVRAYRDRR